MTRLIYFSACVHLAISMSNEYLPVQLYPASILCRVCDACSAGRAHLHFWAESVPAHLRTVSTLTSVALGQHWLCKRGHISGVDCHTRQLIKWLLKRESNWMCSMPHIYKCAVYLLHKLYVPSCACLKSFGNLWTRQSSSYDQRASFWTWNPTIFDGTLGR